VRIAAFPLGLLDLVEASRDGRALSEAADYLQVGLDATDLYGANLQAVLTAQNNLAAGGNTFFTVPVGVMWRVLAASINAQTGGAATAADVSLYVTPPNTANALVHISQPLFDLAINSVGISNLSTPEPLILVPGTVVGVYASAVSGAPAANVSMIVQAFRA